MQAQSRRGILGAIAGGAALLLAALPMTAWAQKTSTLKIVMASDLKVIDPIWVSAQIGRTHAYLIYDTLFALDADLRPQPQMVDSYTVSDDKKVYTFKLRDGLAWHDGQPVKAEDCIQSIKRWASRDGVGQRLMAHTEALDVIDDKTFKLTLKDAYGFVLFSLAKPGSTVPFMMPKRVADTPGSQQIKEATGSGPWIFKTDEWKPGEKVVYVKNPNYKPRAEPPSGLAGGKIAKFDRIEWLWIPDVQTAVSALQNGEVDAMEQLPLDLMPVLEKDKSIVFERGKFANQYTFRPNWLHPPMNNPKVREAIGYALDQRPFLEAQVGNDKFYATCKAYFICGTPLASDAGMQGRLEGNAAKSRELLKEAGYDGTPILLMHSTDLPALTNLAPVAKAQLEAGGFKVDMVDLDWQTLVGRTNKKEPLAQGGWSAFATSWGALDSSNPIVSQNLISSCENATPGWPCDKKIEELRDQFALEGDPAKRKAIADEIQVRAVTLGTHFPLGEWYILFAHRTNTKGWLPPMSAMMFWNAEKTP
ncbi:MAG: ABC transporter substrate-binding protein [Alphaproteobacteria bacterium]|nr:ABC transporter substrate-binding protein [Alphaproteobacteria bacterium]